MTKTSLLHFDSTACVYWIFLYAVTCWCSDVDTLCKFQGLYIFDGYCDQRVHRIAHVRLFYDAIARCFCIIQPSQTGDFSNFINQFSSIS